MTEIEKIASDYIIRERSDYQLRHFVVGQHDTPEMRYRQILIEVRSLVMKIKLAELDVEKRRIKLERLSDDPLDQIKAEKIRLSVGVTLDLIEGARRELQCLVNMAQEYPHYTPQDIENNQEQYWEARLQRQATVDRLSVEQQVSAGNLMSMLQTGLLHREISS